MIITNLSAVLDALGDFSWKDWLYIKEPSKVHPNSECLVLNVDAAEIGSDDFTPLEAEKLGMDEFLSIQDINSVVKNLKSWNSNPSNEQICIAIAHYFEKDAFLPALPNEKLI